MNFGEQILIVQSTILGAETGRRIAEFGRRYDAEAFVRMVNGVSPINLPDIGQEVIAYHPDWRFMISAFDPLTAKIPIGISGDSAERWYPLPEMP